VSAEHDPVVQRAVDELRKLPPLDREAVERVARAAAAARVSPAELDPADMPRRRSIRVWSAVGLASAAAIAGFVIGGARLTKTSEPTTRPVASVAKAPDSGAQLQLATRNPSDVAPIPQQFIFENTHARRVSVVGDFNNWDAKKNVMARDGDGLWSTIVPIVPGRHTYAYMVDDSVFTLDPRKPKTRDPDLGGESSVLMVGRP
jgi:hypothetical protein